MTDKEREIALDVVNCYLDTEIEFSDVYEREDVNEATEDVDLAGIHREAMRILGEVWETFHGEYYR